MQQYYPLSGTTFWLDYHFWKFWTLPYHVENVVLHLIAVLLFWRLLQKLELPGAWLAAGIFALHPVMVESVAWVTERKNVLSMVFFLGALLAYGRFNSFWKTDNVSPRKWVAYVSGFFSFAGGAAGQNNDVFISGGGFIDWLVEEWAHPVARRRAAQPAVFRNRNRHVPA